MAKLAVVAMVLCTLLISGYATETGRALQQKVTYDCNGAKQINKVPSACKLLCTCAGSLNKAYAAPAMNAQCMKLCDACQKAATTCKAGSALPQACQAGTTIKEVNTCITTFLKSQQGK